MCGPVTPMHHFALLISLWGCCTSSRRNFPPIRILMVMLMERTASYPCNFFSPCPYSATPFTSPAKVCRCCETGCWHFVCCCLNEGSFHREFAKQHHFQFGCLGTGSPGREQWALSFSGLTCCFHRSFGNQHSTGDELQEGRG